VQAPNCNTFEKDSPVNSYKAARDKILHLFFGTEGATTVEYAVIVAALILTVIATIYFLAAPDGTGVVPDAFNNVSNQVGQFGKVE
jgi:Flp pilus assembly pilin Flp